MIVDSSTWTGVHDTLEVTSWIYANDMRSFNKGDFIEVRDHGMYVIDKVDSRTCVSVGRYSIFRHIVNKYLKPFTACLFKQKR